MCLKVETRAKPSNLPTRQEETEGVLKMKKEIFCSACGRKFAPVGREHICPACKQEAAAAAKRAAVEKAKARSYAGEACPVRISARARGFIEAVAAQQGSKFIPALDAILKKVATSYGFSSWESVPEHRTERRTSTAQAAKVATTATPSEAPATPSETPVKPVKATASKPKASKASKA